MGTVEDRDRFMEIDDVLANMPTFSLENLRGLLRNEKYNAIKSVVTREIVREEEECFRQGNRNFLPYGERHVV